MSYSSCIWENLSCKENLAALYVNHLPPPAPSPSVRGPPFTFQTNNEHLFYCALTLWVVWHKHARTRVRFKHSLCSSWDVVSSIFIGWCFFLAFTDILSFCANKISTRAFFKFFFNPSFFFPFHHHRLSTLCHFSLCVLCCLFDKRPRTLSLPAHTMRMNLTSSRLLLGALVATSLVGQTVASRSNKTVHLSVTSREGNASSPLLYGAMFEVSLFYTWQFS